MTDDEKRELHEVAFNKMIKSMMTSYHEKFHEFLTSEDVGTITDADVAIMIMNLTIGLATNVYYSVKQILPNNTIDYDFLKVKVINELVDHFEKIKEFTPDTELQQLTEEQIKEIFEVGHIVIKTSNGKSRTVSQEDLLMKKEDVEKLTASANKELSGLNPPKIILPPKRKH